MTTTNTLNIDMDAACPQCGKGGSINGGLCFRCAEGVAERLLILRKQGGKETVTTTSTLEIDMDAACPQCFKLGTVKDGICLRCAMGKLIINPKTEYKGGEMISGIGQKAIDMMIKQTADLINTHKRKIQEAFLQAEEGKMKVGLSVNIQQVGPKLAVETSISYVVEKISDKQSIFIDENQPALFAVEAVGK